MLALHPDKGVQKIASSIEEFDYETSHDKVLSLDVKDQKVETKEKDEKKGIKPCFQ